MMDITPELTRMFEEALGELKKKREIVHLELDCSVDEAVEITQLLKRTRE